MYIDMSTILCYTNNINRWAVLAVDINTITQIISGVGFPVAVCLICFWYINKQEEAHKEEVSKLTDAINNNTLIMQKLCDKLGVDSNADDL